MSSLEVHVHRNPRSLSLELYLRAGRGTRCSIDERGELLIHQIEGSALIEPALRLPDEVGDKLVEELLRAGYRPTKTLPPDETIAALRRHIEFAETVAMLLLKTGRETNDRQPERAGGVGAGNRATTADP